VVRNRVCQNTNEAEQENAFKRLFQHAIPYDLQFNKI
jgi:hypothetical protein